MTRKIFVMSLTVFVFVLWVKSSPAAEPGLLKNYTAVIETTTTKGNFSSTSKVVSKDGKQRIEQSANGKKSVTIVRPDKKLVWMLMPDQNMFMEMPLDVKNQDIFSNMQDSKVKTDKEFLSNETIDNHPAKKYHVTTSRDGKKESSGFIWEASDLNNFPVKYQNEDKTATMVWKNINFEPVQDAMFEIPSGYKKMEMPPRNMNNPAKGQ
ncbi:MAG: DUF4412 domain-containing protein [Nitrospirae bacterium]|nr:DUF4412 domain-containing protein [Nitrospirota bacterium]